MKKWKQLEWYIAEKLNELGIDQYARPTKGSGNSTENGDVFSSIFRIEAKQRNTKNLTIFIDVWEKNKASIPLNSDLIPLLFLENKDKKKFVALETEDFFDLIKEHYNG